MYKINYSKNSTSIVTKLYKRNFKKYISLGIFKLIMSGYVKTMINLKVESKQAK